MGFLSTKIKTKTVKTVNKTQAIKSYKNIMHAKVKVQRIGSY